MIIKYNLSIWLIGNHIYGSAKLVTGISEYLTQCFKIFLRINLTSRIVWTIDDEGLSFCRKGLGEGVEIKVEFIIAGYDPLAVLSSVSGKYGLIRLKCVRETLPELIRLMADIAPDIKKPCL